MTESSAEEVRTRRFDVARRGYDRASVDAFRESVADQVEALEQRLADLEATLSQVGIDDPKDLAAEMEAVGAAVTGILEEARTAAEEMRSRAAADAARWRSEAAASSEAENADAAAAAEEVRRSVWETGTAMLADVVAEEDAVLRGAEQDALFIRAEAEREALRLTGEARRERDEELRAARQEVEQMLATARHESDTLLESARQQAEAAQERARALEQRRAELLEELEAARASIGELEAESDARRSEAETVEAETSPPIDEIESRWSEDEGSVRIVAADRVVVSEPVDALQIAAEVEALRHAAEQAPEPEPAAAAEAEPATQPKPEPAGAADAVPADVEAEQPAGAAEPAVEAPPEPETAAQPEPGPTAQPEPEIAPEPAPEPEPEPEPEPVAEAEPEPELTDELAGLFASLRKPTEPEAPEAAAQPQGADEGAVADEELRPAPPMAAAGSLTVEPEPGAPDPFAVRERLLLPIANQALRGIKRALVDLQNLALEELRTHDGWTPDRDAFAAVFAADVQVVARESAVAGYTGAAELAGTAEAPPAPPAGPADDVEHFGTELADAVTDAITTARGGGAGPRQVAASVSRVFRAWRTDDAERRVRTVAYAAYHTALLTALAELGVDRVRGWAAGRPCPHCPAGERWEIGEGPPPGTVVPPSEVDCVCTVGPG